MRPFIPDKLPPSLEWGELVSLIGNGNAALARFDGMLQSMVNPEILLSPITLREAVLSSRIEGTQASLAEVLQHEAGEEFSEQKRQDIREIINYRRALFAAEEMLRKKPLSLNVIKELHSILLEGTRGHHSARGEFRRIQNWIGAPGSTIETATYVPPDVPHMKEALDLWEKYIHTDEKDPLVHLALVHAQFEIIHPFLDGNGRIGRMLIPLFLTEKAVLSKPVFYLSSYLESHREDYYSFLNRVTSRNDWQGWVVFFLRAVVEQAHENTEKGQAIHGLYEEMKKAVVEITRSQYAIAALDTIFKKPVFTSTDFIRISKIPNQTAWSIMRQLKGEGVLKELRLAGGRKPALMGFPKLVNIAEGRNVL